MSDAQVKIKEFKKEKQDHENRRCENTELAEKLGMKFVYIDDMKADIEEIIVFLHFRG